uniref:Uncharacterized protein n=1 Tax=Anguilla anguilla TaxID=7936 RepID=A0A0E9U5B9_ANGAN
MQVRNLSCGHTKNIYTYFQNTELAMAPLCRLTSAVKFGSIIMSLCASGNEVWYV